MKKKKLGLSKKLLLKKESIVELGAQQTSKLAGGMPVTWWSACCKVTNEFTCPATCIH
jgi:hypothetical protein